MLDLLLIEMCKAPGVSTNTIAAVIKAESSGNEFAYNVNQKHYAMKKRLSKSETFVEVEALLAKGEDIDMGLMQINSSHLKKRGLSVPEIYEPCTNIRIGSEILQDAYRAAAKVYGEGQTALQGALSIYNTGNLSSGHQNGYVEKFYGKSAASNEDPYTVEISVGLTNEVNYAN